MAFWQMLKEGNDHLRGRRASSRRSTSATSTTCSMPAVAGGGSINSARRPLPGLCSARGDRRRGAGEAADRRAPNGRAGRAPARRPSPVAHRRRRRHAPRCSWRGERTVGIGPHPRRPPGDHARRHRARPRLPARDRHARSAESARADGGPQRPRRRRQVVRRASSARTARSVAAARFSLAERGSQPARDLHAQAEAARRTCAGRRRPKPKRRSRRTTRQPSREPQAAAAGRGQANPAPQRAKPSRRGAVRWTRRASAASARPVESFDSRWSPPVCNNRNRRSRSSTTADGRERTCRP